MNEMKGEVDLNKCAECKKPFKLGQEYGELKDKQANKVSMDTCLTCWDKGDTNKKQGKG